MASETTLTLGDEISELYIKLLSGLPQAAATLTRKPSKDPGGEDIEIVPTNSKSARIYVHPMADWIYTLIGRNTSVELFLSWQKEERALEGLKEISQAVIAGSFSEDIWMLDGKVVRSSGTIEIGGRRKKIGRFLTFSNPLRRKQRQHFDYVPYVSPEHGKLGDGDL
jgi:hypothetical protein